MLTNFGGHPSLDRITHSPGLLTVSNALMLRGVTRRRWFVLVLMALTLACLCPLLYLTITTNAKLYKLPVSQAVKERYSEQHADSESAEPPVTRILLVTYGRSGSTFTSYILKEAPDSFFFFEPLRALLTRSNAARDSIIMSHGAIGGRALPVQERALSNLTTYERKAVDLLDHLLSCEIGTFPVTDYISPHFQLHGDVSKVAWCLRGMVKDTYLNLSHYLQCVLDFWHACQRSRHRLFKLIRLPVRSLFGLMRRYQDLRVVYLVRDPRAILASQRALFGHAPRAVEFCSMVVDDAAHMKLLLETFPGRGVAVRYEDIAQDALNYTRRLFDALRLPLTDNALANVRRLVSSSSYVAAVAGSKGGNRSRPSAGGGQDYSAFRSDPRKAANQWRTKIALSAVRADDSVCGSAYEWLGYRVVSNMSVLTSVETPLTIDSFRLPLL